MKFRQLAMLGVMATAAMTAPFSAMAEGHWRGGDIRHFGHADAHRWAGGHWYHGSHDGRLGWWWVVGGALETALWYSYATPVYPYPDPYAPGTVVVQPAATVATVPLTPAPAVPANWYFCRGSNQYYPYVATCPGGWIPVPAVPPGQ